MQRGHIGSGIDPREKARQDGERKIKNFQKGMKISSNVVAGMANKLYKLALDQQLIRGNCSTNIFPL